MRIISWNIAGGHTLDEESKIELNYEKENLDYFIDQIKNIDADIVALQESHFVEKDELNSQPKIISEILGYSYFKMHKYGRSHIKKGSFLSLATLSKYPIKTSFFHRLPNPNLRIYRPDGEEWVSFDVGFLVTQIEYKKININILNCHLVPFYYFNRDFSEPEFDNIREDIVSLLNSFHDSPALVLGDFNFDNINDVLPGIFYKNRFIEVFRNIKTTQYKGQQDHIIYSNLIKANGFEIIRTKSDHYLCVFDFLLK